MKTRCLRRAGASRVPVVLLACATSCGLAQGAPSSQKIARPGVASPAGFGRLDEIRKQAVFPVAGSPDWSVVTPDGVWVASARLNHVVALDPVTNMPGRVATVNRPCSGLAAAFDSVWVPSCGDHDIVRLDPKTAKGVATIAAEPANSEGGITVGAGSVWIVAKPGRLIRIDPRTNEIVASLDLPAGATNVAFGGGSVWVSSHEQNSLLRVDPASMRVVATAAIGPGPRFLAVGDDSVWTLNQGDGSISRVSLADSRLLTTIPCGIPGEGGEIAYGEGRVWATMFDVPLTELDPKTNQVVRQWKGQGGDGLRVGLGSLWLSNLRQQTVWRIDPKQL